MQNVRSTGESLSSQSPVVRDRRVSIRMVYEQVGQDEMSWWSEPEPPRGPAPFGNVGAGTTEAAVILSIDQAAISS